MHYLIEQSRTCSNTKIKLVKQNKITRQIGRQTCSKTREIAPRN